MCKDLLQSLTLPGVSDSIATMTNFAAAAPAIRALLEAEGIPVVIDERKRERYPTYPDLWVSNYGWKYDAAHLHVHPRRGAPEDGCAFVIPEGAELIETTYSEFMDTVAGNKDEIGINAYGGPADAPTTIQCVCGKYKGLTLRLEGSLGDIIQAVLPLQKLTF